MKRKELTPGGFVKKAIALWKSDNKVISIDAFITAVISGDIKTIESSVYLQNYITNSCVFEAAVKSDQRKVVEWLLQNGLDPNAKLSPCETPLICIGMEHDNDAIFQLLLDAGADLKVDECGVRVLIHAAKFGAVAILRRLIGMGIDVNSRRKSDGATALHEAETVETARVLIEAKANPMLTTTDNRESVLYSQTRDDPEVFDYIWSILTDDQRTVLLTLKTLDQRTILHAAARSGMPSIVEFLLERPEIDAAAIDKNGSTPLMEFMIGNEDDYQLCAELILETDRGRSTINAAAAGHNGFTALHQAMNWAGSNAKSLDLFLEFGQLTIPHTIQLSPNPDHVHLVSRVILPLALFGAGADLKIKDLNGETPLDKLNGEERNKLVTKLHALKKAQIAAAKSEARATFIAKLKTAKSNARATLIAELKTKARIVDAKSSNSSANALMVLNTLLTMSSDSAEAGNDGDARNAKRTRSSEDGQPAPKRARNSAAKSSDSSNTCTEYPV